MPSLDDFPFLFASGPKLNDLLTPKLTEKKPGPRPSLRGIIVCPASGSRSKAPRRVTITLDRERSVANAGRSVNRVSPFVSRPVVILNGAPDLTKIMGLNESFHGPVIHPPK